MAKLLKLRRGTTSQHSSFTGAEGEVTVDTDKDTLVVHDGSTAGGHPVAAEDMANVSSASIAGRLSNDSIAPSKIAAGALPSDVTVATANLGTTGVTAGQYGSSSAIPIVTVNNKGQVTAASTTGIDSTRIENGTSNVRINNVGNILVSRTGTDRLTINNSGVDVTGTLDVTGDITTTGKVKFANVYSQESDLPSASTYHGMFAHVHGTGLAYYAHGGNWIKLAKLDAPDFTGGIDVSGNISVTGTVDGRDVAQDGGKIDELYGGSNTLKSTVNIANGVTATTQGTSDNSTKVATTAYVTTAVANAEPFPSGTKMIFQQSAAPTGWTKVTSNVNNKALRLVSGNVSSGGNQSFTSAFASRTPAGNVGTSGNSSASFSANSTTGNSTASFSGSVSGNTGNSGASTSSVSTSGSVNNHTLSNNQVPSHSHSFNVGNPDSYGSGYRIVRDNSNNAGNFGTNSSGGGGSHSHGFSGSSHSHNVNNHTHSFSGNFSGNTGNHTHSVSVSGNTGNHTHSGGSFSGSAMDFAVQYIDVIVCSKD